MDKKSIRYSFNLDPKLHKKIKVHTALQELNMSDYITGLIEEDLEKKWEKIPNKETLEAMKEVEEILSGKRKSTPITIDDLRNMMEEE